LEVVFRPIGYVRVSVPDDVVRSSLEGVEGYVEVLPEYEAGLEGLDGFSHLIIVAYLHRIPLEGRATLKVKPRKWVKLGIPEAEIPEVGVFATDSPYRPNPIAITIVRLLGRSGRILHVSELDLFDGTPVLDIKPYTYARRVDDLRVPQWYSSLLERVKTLYPNAKEI